MIPTSKCFKWHLACSIHDARGRIFPTCERARKDRLRPQHIFSGRRVSRSQYAAQLSLRARRAPSHNPPHRPSAWRDDAGALPAVRTGVSAWGPSVSRERDDQLAELLTDWADESLDVAARAPLVDALPTLDATAVEPSKWQPAANSSEMESKVNQTIAGSVATIPR